MAKVVVKKDSCIGCGVCAAVCASVFTMADDGLAENVLGEDVPEDLMEEVKEAVEACPVQAIEIE
ncbi:ferredoxin [bacterium]|jgi:ferredoxin|nr:ferredoxin [bacterium]